MNTDLFGLSIRWPVRLPVLLGVASLLALLPAAALAQRELGGCDASVEGGTLSVTGDEAANVIEFVGTERGVQATCDGVADTFADVEEVVVEGGDGDDQVTVDNSNGLLGGIAFNVFGQGGHDQLKTEQLLKPTIGPIDVDGGSGEDLMEVIFGALADRFDITPGSDPGSLEVTVTDPATGDELANITGVALESATFKGGDGNDEFDLRTIAPGFAGIAFSFLGEGGDDVLRVFSLSSHASPAGAIPLEDVGGPGHDIFSVAGLTGPEHYLVAGVPDVEVPDPQVLVTDLLTGLETLVADLGEGDDTLTAEILPVRTPPDPVRVQSALFDVTAGGGDDAVTFNHSAGGWFDVTFTADLGTGDDSFDAVFEPPPDDSLPGLEGMRLLDFDVVAGEGEDFVGVHNDTTGFFDLSVTADLDHGDDTLEATGEMALLAQPGEGFDTARVSRDLVELVSEFESVELI